MCSRPFRKQPIGKTGALRCSSGDTTTPVQITHVGQPSALPTSLGFPFHSRLLTHHHTLGSRCPEGAWQGMDTGWHIPAGGIGCGPPSKGRQRKDPPPGFSQETEMALESQPSTHWMFLWDEMHPHPQGSYVEVVAPGASDYFLFWKQSW